jgi:hypothetical protein
MKQLPKINDILFDITIPSTDTKIKMRPFKVLEEKLLLTASASEDPKFISDTVRQVINNCVVSAPTDFNVDKLAVFDLEFVFLYLRGKSVNNVIPLEIVEDGETYKGEIDLDQIKVVKNPEHSNKIEVNDTVGVIMSYPTIDFSKKLEGAAENDVIDIVALCLEKIFDSDEVYVRGDDFGDKEANEFILSLPGTALKKILMFFETMPVIKADVVLKNKDGSKEKKFELKGMQSFF